jgi:pilus assembly protein FimV
MNEQLMLALESSAAQRKENEELQSRVGNLEEQLQDMQRLLALKDADLAALQQQLREQGEAVSLPSEEAEPQPMVSKPEGETEAMPVEKPAAEEPGEMVAKGEADEAMPAEEMPAPVDEKMAATEMARPGDEKPVSEAVKPEQQKPEPAQKSAPKPKPAVKPRPVQQPSFIDTMLQDPIMLGAGGGTLVLLLILAMILIRRRRKGGFQESILSGGTSSMLSTKAGEGTGETSFLSDLAISGMGGGAITADEGEVDPLTEADVFMAYGRNQQAEEVLKKALEGNPERPEVIAKLLEVYYNTKDKEQFEALANESASTLQGNEEQWGKVAAMGRELSPESELFAGAEIAEVQSQEPVTKPEPVTDEVLDIGLDLDELTAEMESEVNEESLDLGMDFETEEEKKPAEGPAAETGELSDMDFELDLGAETEEPAAEAEESSDFDFDLGDLETEEEKPQEASTPVESEELGDLDFDLGDLGAESEEQPAAGEEPSSAAEAVAEAETKVTADAGEMDLDDFDFGDLDLEGGAEEPAAQPAVESAEEEFGSLDLGELESESGDLDEFGDLGDLEDDAMLSDSDEITTKLDLAQAYIEMGDNDGARSMLEEVVEGGNDEQKQQAQELLSKI